MSQHRKKFKRRLPPGQRLLRYFCLALLLLATPIACLPTEVSRTSAFTNQAQSQTQILPQNTDTIALPPFLMSQRLTDTEAAIKAVANQPGLDAGVFAVEPTTGNYIDVNAHKTYSAASMIKMPVMVALLYALDQHQVRMEHILTLRPELIGGGSGMLQWRPVGSKIMLKQAAELMLVISDNTATNLIIDLLGGKEAVNKQWEQWGLNHTRINNFLPDLEGTNYTTPYDLIFLLGRVQRGEILSPQSRQYLFSVMERCHTRTLLPHCLLPGDVVAHKTGDIGSMVGDAGMITTAGNGNVHSDNNGNYLGSEGEHLNGSKQYFIAVQVKRPHNDLRANELVRVIAAIVYSKIVGKDCACSKTFAPPSAVHHAIRHHAARHHHATVNNNTVQRSKSRHHNPQPAAKRTHRRRHSSKT